MSSKRNQTIAIARFLMYKYGLNQQLEGMTDEEYMAHPIGLDVGQYVADLMKYCPEHIVDQVMEHQDAPFAAPWYGLPHRHSLYAL